MRVIIRLQGGESLVAGSFPNREIAALRARGLVAHLSSLAADEWPLIGDHFVRPASIASIQLVRVAVPVPEWLTDDELLDGEGEARAASD